MRHLTQVAYALRAERALVASQTVAGLAYKPGDSLPVDEFRSVDEFDVWLEAPLGDDAAAEDSLVSYLRGA